MQIDLTDPTLFGNDAAEEENPEILASYFVDRSDFSKFFSLKQRLQFARSRKGMGKSALLSKLAYDLDRGDENVILTSITGSDLTALGEFTSPDPSVLINQWQQVICARITQEIGKRINFAVTDADMLMVQSAELAGLRSRNIVGSLIDRLEGKLGPLSLKKPQVASYLALLQGFRDRSKDTKVWLLVDDIDSMFISTSQFSLKLATFFSACRKLVRDVANLHIRASVRTDVWTMLRRHEDLDKAEQYMTDLVWSTDQMKRILAKRILSYLERSGSAQAKSYTLDTDQGASEIIELVFDPKMRWGTETVEPILPVNLLSGKRPRWMAQLCRLASIYAAKHRQPKIRIYDMAAVMRPFGRFRLGDLHKEHGHQCVGLQPLIEAFAGGPPTYTTDELLARVDGCYLKKVLSKGTLLLDDKPVTDALELCHFLYRIGFIEGQSPQGGDPWELVSYEDRPDLLREETNLDDGLIWSLHPSYRTTLRVKQIFDSAS